MICVALLLGLVSGAGGMHALLGQPSLLRAAERDGWSGNAIVGSTQADILTRAVVARFGLLALNRTEAVYFARQTDTQGRPLREACEYVLRGGPQSARWWSITLYAEDSFLAQNTDEAHSVDASRVVTNDAGDYEIRIARERGNAENWLSSRASQMPTLLLRLYHPDPSAVPGGVVSAGQKPAQLPTLVRTGCDEEDA